MTGENRNDVLGSEKKAYSGALVNGAIRRRPRSRPFRQAAPLHIGDGPYKVERSAGKRRYDPWPGVMRVMATFESGATIEYHGTVTAALTFQAAAGHFMQPLYAPLHICHSRFSIQKKQAWS